MPQVLPVHLEPRVIKHMHHLMHEGILHMTLRPEPVLTKKDPGFRTESPGAGELAWLAVDVVFGYFGTVRMEVFDHEGHRGACEGGCE